MVTLDKKFEELSRNLYRWSDKKLLNFRKEQIHHLFDGQVESRDNEERKALIELIDKELERRYKRQAITTSWIALIVSIASILISVLSKR